MQTGNDPTTVAGDAGRSFTREDRPPPRPKPHANGMVDRSITRGGMDIMRLALMGMALAVTLAGCASAGNPVAPGPHATGAFETKLLNLFSTGSQLADQTNFVANNQLNLTDQRVGSTTSALFPIASVVGTGNASATNATAQSIINNVNQNQNQNQLVL
jgi:hypothetical protein